MAHQSNTLTRRYSRALWDVDSGQNADKHLLELESFSNLLNESGELKNFLTSPSFGQDEKQKLTDSLADKLSLSSSTKNFLKILLNNQRLTSLSEIREDYRLLKLQNENALEVNIETAIALSDSDAEQIKKAFEQSLKKTVKLNVVVNDSLTAGLKANVSGQEIDSTVLNYMDLLKTELLGTKA